MQRGRIWQELYRSQYFEWGRVLLAAQSAIDIALYDIVGKKLGVPVYELLGGKHRDVIPCFATASGSTGEEMLAQAKLLKENGWEVIRTGTLLPRPLSGPDRFEPRQSIAYTAEWLINIREELGSEIVLGIDYHHRLSLAETASFCERLFVCM